MCIDIYIYICIHIYIHIYIYGEWDAVGGGIFAMSFVCVCVF